MEKNEMNVKVEEKRFSKEARKDKLLALCACSIFAVTLLIALIN